MIVDFVEARLVARRDEFLQDFAAVKRWEPNAQFSGRFADQLIIQRHDPAGKRCDKLAALRQTDVLPSRLKYVVTEDASQALDLGADGRLRQTKRSRGL